MGVQEHERLPSTASRPFDQIFPICMRAGFKSESPEHEESQHCDVYVPDVVKPGSDIVQGWSGGGSNPRSTRLKYPTKSAKDILSSIHE